ncbi:serine hydrolase domain-containing protein [Floricoccus penangensis]|uniref:serine hydrolase domain-containing protein n=1 Tax=Floricoccus penangensis TaxID=1859475 RepID=UPI00203E73B2|nr:serine hydrolase domain-containing protein [Floricoccus penangensis]URZ87277.1 beta-lactamase family protein [Floricoccus penangensis]
MDTKRSQRYNKKKKRKLKLIPFLILVAILSLASSIFVTNTIFTIVSKSEAKHHSEIQADENSKEKVSESTTESTTQQSTEKKETFPTSTDGTIISPIPANNYENLSKTVLAPEAQNMDTELDAASFVGVALVIKNGQIILQKGYGYADYSENRLNTVNSHIQIGSVQKAYTATLIYKLIEEKKLSFDTPLSDFYPQIYGSQNITIMDMIRMHSGLQISIPGNAYFSTTDQVMDYIVTNVENTGQKTYKYQAVNYSLLAGIIEKITGKSYYENYENFFHNVGLKNFGQYIDWPERPGYTTGYKKSGEYLYSLPNPYDPQIFIRELGTGNIDSTAGDVYEFFNKLLTGGLIKSSVLQEVWKPIYSDSNTYIGGFYDQGDAYRMNGVINYQQLAILISKDTKNAVILFSNRGNQELTQPTISSFYQQITGNYVKF